MLMGRWSTPLKRCMPHTRPRFCGDPEFSSSTCTHAFCEQKTTCCFPEVKFTPLIAFSKMSMNMPCTTRHTAPSFSFHPSAISHSHCFTCKTLACACGTVSHPLCSLHQPLISSTGTTQAGNSLSSCAFVNPGRPTTPPTDPGLPSKHPPCSWISARTVIGTPSLADMGVAVSMHRRMGDTSSFLIWCFPGIDPSATAPSPNRSPTNFPSAAACLNPVSVSVGSESRSGFIRDGTESALFALCAWRTT
mmetsp:Transcript_399/g.1558  ORF Transcript_399/g.1558 Transcript_399/m.1558 type:complete len:248 (-) Transcript_399:187-930(-)